MARFVQYRNGMRASHPFPKIVVLLLSLCIALPAVARQRDRSTTRQKLTGPVRPTGQLAATRVLPWGRTIDPNHPLRKQVQSESLLRATVGLLGGNDVAMLPRHVRKALSKKAGKSSRSLRQKKTQLALIDTLRRAVGDQRFEQIAGSQAAGLKTALEQLNQPSWGPQDHQDMQRGWGFQLLPKNDKAFSDPTFLTRMLRESGQTGHGMVHNEPTQARYVFDAAWRKVAPANTHPISFTLTGSDANNLLYSVAKVAAEKRLGKKVDSAELLYFDGVYGGGRGKIAGASFLHYGKDGAPDLSAYKIDSPHTPYFKPKAKAEIARLEKIEAQALAQIEQKVTTSAKPIGGLLLEPILGAKGVYFYRPEFMTKLRTLCDKLKIPIMADEVLTGGGRTGKFFAYEHYKGFEPDFVTFGKGLQVAGVAQVSRQGVYSRSPSQMTTLTSYSEPLLKGAQVLTRIHEGKLIENAARVGAHIVKKLRAHQKAHPRDYRDAEGPVRGMGMLIFSRIRPHGVMDAMGRLMPPLTLTKAQADQVFSAKELGR